MATKDHARKFFFRGLGIILPTVLTAWLFYYAYTFVETRIAGPINSGIQIAIVQYTPWPKAIETDYGPVLEGLTQTQRDEMRVFVDLQRGQLNGRAAPPNFLQAQQLMWMEQQPGLVLEARTVALTRWWNTVKIGNFNVLNIIGLIVAIALIYVVGVFLSGIIGRRFYNIGERLINRLPLIRRIYPSVKQVTDFFFDEDRDQTMKFNRVVAVEYPRKGLWSVGLVTGSTMKAIQDKAGETCLTVFIPSSPTPFTGYVITIAEKDTIELDITIEEALKFAVSLGVLVPPSQDSIKNTQSLDSSELGLSSASDKDDTDTKTNPHDSGA